MPAAGPKFKRLCAAAAQRGLYPGLVASSKAHIKHRPDNTVARWRDIIALELTNKEGAVVAAEAMRGIEDLERAAGVLL